MLLGVVLSIDSGKSTATFSVSHIFVERVEGTVAIAAGTIDLPEGSTVPTRGVATLDASRLHTDEPDRDAALRGSQWFDVARFPTWTFTSTTIVPTASGFTMQGFLTIHGVTQSEKLDVVTRGTGDRPTYRATARIDRHAFGMEKTRLDPVIGNLVDVTLDISVK